ncbi:MAG: DUF1287 domain-containing protein [Oxalobacter sp.]|nr:DUF1287 domain-containing protein [Oxalobacter sp.]
MPDLVPRQLMKSRDGAPLVIHNINSSAQKENILHIYTITGHYRYNKNNKSRRFPVLRHSKFTL